MQHVGERPVDRMTLHIYPGDGVSWLYQDDGKSPAYRQGQYRLTRFSLAASEGRVDLTRQVEGSFDPGYDGFRVVVHGVEGPPDAVEGLPGAEVVFNPQDHTLRVSEGSFDALRVRW
jgi:hypothetical protein